VPVPPMPIPNYTPESLLYTFPPVVSFSIVGFYTMESLIHVQACVSKPALQVIEASAEREKRTRSSMIRVLVEEAIETRQKGNKR